ncbi:MBL fold metallo-hydrolase [Hyphomonas sp.]|uniref:MBL fold metallo-hydrolase n=1 Tax=Hyphomonas sp. TaxID=87 RepID=UPI0035271E9B
MLSRNNEPLLGRIRITTASLIVFLGVAGCSHDAPETKVANQGQSGLDRPFAIGTPAEIPMRIAEIAPHFHLVTGRGGNSLIFDAGDSLVLVDTKLMYPAAWQELKSLGQQATGGDRFDWVFMTHHHADHSGGNAFAQADGATVIAQTNTSETLERYIAKIAPMNPSKADVVFDAVYELDVAGHPVRAYYWGPAHTNGDIAVHFPDAGVIAAGDLVFGSGTFAVDAIDGRGSLIGALERVDDILSLEFEILVPGHGEYIMTRDEVVLYRERLSLLVDRGRAAVRRGVPVDGLRDALEGHELGFRLAGHFWMDPRYVAPIHAELVALEAEQETP